MSVMELLTTRRTYRRFAQKAVPQDVVDDIVQAVRLSSCGAKPAGGASGAGAKPGNGRQGTAAGQVGWLSAAGAGTPKADELPHPFYAAVVQDTAIPGDLATDTGIALANMTLAAWDKGVGSCIMGAINKPALTALLGIEEPQKLAFMVAFGYPTHKSPHRTHDRADRRKVLSGRKPRLLRAQAQRGGDRKKPVNNGLYCIYSYVFSVIA